MDDTIEIRWHQAGEGYHEADIVILSPDGVCYLDELWNSPKVEINHKLRQRRLYVSALETLDLPVFSRGKSFLQKERGGFDLRIYFRNEEEMVLFKLLFTWVWEP